MSIREEIELMVQDANPDAMFMDGLDDAILGIGCQWGAKPLVIYSATKIIESLMKGDDGMDHETALEWYGHNIECAYVGEGTPIIVDDWIVDTREKTEQLGSTFTR